MKKLIKRKSILCLIMCIVFAISMLFCINVSANNSDTSNINTNNAYVSQQAAEKIACIQIANDMKMDQNCQWKPGVNLSFSNCILLYDSNNNPSAYMFKIKSKEGNDNGYIVISATRDTNPIIEFSYSGKPFIDQAISKINKISDKTNKKMKVYFLGDLNYAIGFESSDSKEDIYDISTGEVKKIDRQSLKDINSQYLSGRDSRINDYKELWDKWDDLGTGGSNPPDSGSTYITDPDSYESGYSTLTYKMYTWGAANLTAFKTMDNFSYVNGTSYSNHCAPTAAINLVRMWYVQDMTLYHDLYSGYDWVNDFVRFHTLMGTTDATGTPDANLAFAYAAFFGERGFPFTATLSAYSDSTALSELTNERPFHLALHNHYRYGNHSVIGFGYRQYRYTFLGITTSLSTYIHIADGWSSDHSGRFVWSGSSSASTWKMVTVTPN